MPADRIGVLPFSSLFVALSLLLIPGVFRQALALVESMGGLAFLLVPGVFGVSLLTLPIGIRLVGIHGL
jgi:hypothetical protein